MMLLSEGLEMRIMVFTIAALCSTLLASAQTIVQPGQLASPALVSVQPARAAQYDRHDRLVNRVWMLSMATMVAGSSMDAATSWGKEEGNGLLASGNGTFGARGISIKAGMAAAVIVPQILLRKHKNLRAKFILGNFLEAGIFTGVSVHNLHVTAPAN
jgi:hypothetical protein